MGIYPAWRIVNMFSICAVQEIQEASLKYTLEIIIALISILIAFGGVLKYINSKVSKKAYYFDREKDKEEMKEYVELQINPVKDVNKKISEDLSYIRRRLDEHIDGTSIKKK